MSGSGAPGGTKTPPFMPSLKAEMRMWRTAPGLMVVSHASGVMTVSFSSTISYAPSLTRFQSLLTSLKRWWIDKRAPCRRRSVGNSWSVRKGWSYLNGTALLKRNIILSTENISHVNGFCSRIDRHVHNRDIRTGGDVHSD